MESQVSFLKIFYPFNNLIAIISRQMVIILQIISKNMNFDYDVWENAAQMFFLTYFFAESLNIAELIPHYY